MFQSCILEGELAFLYLAEAHVPKTAFQDGDKSLQRQSQDCCVNLVPQIRREYVPRRSRWIQDEKEKTAREHQAR